MKEHTYFFSIVIPAHNEEFLISKTLSHLLDLDYPKDKYEVIVIENASTDGTFALANSFSNEQVHVFHLDTKGVSIAKNAGIERISQESKWTIFLDADTIFQPTTLRECNAFLQKKSNRNLAVGTTKVRPLGETFGSKTWFSFYNVSHKLTKTSFALQIVRSDLLRHIRFNERLAMGEDLQIITDAKRKGTFFYVPLEGVYTSTRRFEKEGWWYTFFLWIFVAILPRVFQRRFVYKTIR